jgi:hypothetical protein
VALGRVDATQRRTKKMTRRRGSLRWQRDLKEINIQLLENVEDKCVREA